MSYPVGTICYVDDLHETARKHGFDSWRLMLADRYRQLQSTRKVGAIFGRSDRWVSEQLKRMGIPRRKTGGRVYTRWVDEIIPCNNCTGIAARTSRVSGEGVCSSCYGKETKAREKRNRDYIQEHRVTI
jgi:hypothetical protein